MKYIYLLCLTGMMCYACTGQQKEQENLEFSVSGDTIMVSSESPIAKKLKISEVQKELHETTFTVSGIVKAQSLCRNSLSVCRTGDALLYPSGTKSG